MPVLRGESEDQDHPRKRKLQHAPDIEVNPSAPQPLSKKALRKAKKKGSELPSAVLPIVGDDTPSRPSSNQGQRSTYGIWIGNLPFSATKDDLRRFFTARCSFTETTITRVHLPTALEKGIGKVTNKGFAYVDFSNQKALHEALGLSEQLLSGRRVLIKDAQDFDGRPIQHQLPGTSSAILAKPPSRRLFIGNLGFDATKELLEEHFSQCGVVTNVHVATFEDSGKCKGFAWVEFQDLEAAQAAVQGFLRVERKTDSGGDDFGVGSDDDRPTQPGEPKTKKARVHRLLGRQLRMEFAEDATIRYRRRFGKETRDHPRNSGSASGLLEQDADSHPTREKRSIRKPARYSRETVQRLSGGIVESRGKKITFD